jgi:hypothetical protein
MGRKCGNGRDFVCTNTHVFAVAAVFGRQNELFLYTVVVTLRPAIITAWLQQLATPPLAK